MSEGLLRRLFWRVADQIDYLVTWRGCASWTSWPAPLPETDADRQRNRDREQIKKAFPEIEP